ncbi:MAG TPA: glycoside hydrolase family 3 N-terminal domain-containing protein [Candidatus Limnocylindrales bacterium]|nr:glycoside hydrolase family 3 N-terminal domain-containing protein [Candidatus Limnocylindrales bacterium]
MKHLLAVALAGSLAVGCVGTSSAPPAAAILALARMPVPARGAPVSTQLAAPGLAQLVGQKLVVRMDGLVPSADLLGRIRRGEVGGVILFGSNISTPTALIALTRLLQRTAVAGGQPPLLIAVDQEGGPIKRISWIAPWLSAPQMGRIGLTSVARAQGEAAGSGLRALGVNVDLAPVADVPASTASFMYRAGRTFAFGSLLTASLADAFATGLESGGVDPAMKHFPGIGFATRNTDASVVTIAASPTALSPGLRPYRLAIGHRIPLIMLSNATYPAWDAVNAAGWSRAIGQTLLRQGLGFTGVTITDSLDGTAAARGLTTRLLAVRAARAGTDMILTTGSEVQTRAVYATLLREAQLGWIPTATLRASYARIATLKAGL